MVAGNGKNSLACEPGDGGLAINACIGSGPLVFDNAGNLYFVESSTYIRRISPDGIIDKFAGYGQLGSGAAALDTRFGRITSLAIDASGALYVGQSIAPPLGRISRIDAEGLVSIVAGSGTDGEGPAAQVKFSVIAALASDGNGNVYIADNKISIVNLNTIRQLKPDSTVKTIAGGAVEAAPDGTLAMEAGFANPAGIAISRSGECYISEMAPCTVR